MQKLDNTSPHFICCIKPNESQFPGVYDNNFVLRQLRCCGILEVIRLSRYCYPTQMTHQQFSRRSLSIYYHIPSKYHNFIIALTNCKCSSGMGSFFQRQLHLKILSVFQWLFFNSSIFQLACIKLVILSYFSRNDR